jgi:hypothetical protein
MSSTKTFKNKEKRPWKEISPKYTSSSNLYTSRYTTNLHVKRKAEV